MVPEGWGRFSVGDVFEVQLGKMLNQIAKDGEEQRDYLTNINVRWGQFDLSSLNRMHFNAKERGKFRLKAGDLIVCEGGEVGRCAIWKDALVECYYQKALHRLRPKEGTVLPEYAYMFFEHGNTNGLFLHYSTRSSIAHLTREKLVQVPILLPPLPEQQKIADILSTWDQAIEKTEALLSNARTQKRALMQQLLTGKRRFPEFEGESWTTGSLELLAEIHMGQSPAGDTYNVDGIGTPLLNGPTEFTDRHPIARQWTTKPTKMCIAGDVLVCVRGSSTGRMNIADGPYCIGRGVAAIRKRGELADTVYLQRLLQSLVEIVLSRAAGSTFPNIDKKSLNAIQVSIPPVDAQRKVGTVLLDADRQIDNYSSDLTKLRTEKKALMQQLLTGKRRVVA